MLEASALELQIPTLSSSQTAAPFAAHVEAVWACLPWIGSGNDPNQPTQPRPVYGYEVDFFGIYQYFSFFG